MVAEANDVRVASVGAFAEREDFMARLINALATSEKRQLLAAGARSCRGPARRALQVFSRIRILRLGDASVRRWSNTIAAMLRK